MFYGQCWKCGERWGLGTASTCKCPDTEPVKFAFKESNDSTEVLRVTPEGEFIWHPDADKLLAEGDFSQSPALPHILKALRKQRHEQEPVAWLHTKIEGVAVPHRPADLDKHPDRWEALYRTPPPCPTCEALARTVMLDQTSHDNISPQRTWVGLTDDERNTIARHHAYVDNIIKATEAKLKEKNT